MLALYFFIFIIGIVLLAWSAERFVTASANIAYHFQISPLLIGMSIVAIGTSLPEIFVSIFAIIQGTAAIAIGNAIGSNIANLGLVLGFTALIKPLYVRSSILRRELPILLLVMVLVYVFMLDEYLTISDGIILLLASVVVTFTLTSIAKHLPTFDPLSQEYQSLLHPKNKILYQWIWILIGIILLAISAQMVVWSAVNTARVLGISELFIGLTLVAVGTSLPEIAVSIISARRKQFDIAIGNVIGSNIFNLLIVLAIPTIFSPQPIHTASLRYDMLWMFVLTIIVYITCYGFRGHQGRINRVEGSILLMIYIMYIVYLSFLEEASLRIFIYTH